MCSRLRVSHTAAHPDHTSTVNSVVGNNTLHMELELFDTPQQTYDLTPQQRDRLIAHGRQDAAHALLNSLAALRQLEQLRQTVWAIVNFAVVVIAVGTWYLFR